MDFPALPPLLLSDHTSILTSAITDAGLIPEDILVPLAIEPRLGVAMASRGEAAALVTTINVAAVVAFGTSIILLTEIASVAQAAVVTTAASNSTPYGYSQAQANAIVTLANEMRRVLVEKGLMKGSA